MSITSNADNFSDFISSGVDPRTGTYSFSIKLAEFMSHKTLGASFSLMLNYSASSSNDMGFGRGWGLALSRFDKNSNTLSLSTGQSFKIDFNFSTSEYSIPYRKLKDLWVFYDEPTDSVKIVYKDGRQEFIDYDSGTLTKIVSTQGLETQFNYIDYHQQKVLHEIIDNAGRTLTIDRVNTKTTVTHSVNNSVYQTLKLSKSNNGIYQRLSSVQLPDTDSTFDLEYEYVSSSGYDLITRVIHPSGLDEAITYRHNGHSLPHGAPITSVPYVTEHRVLCGANQSDQVTNYTYSDKNYLGFASERAFVAGEDTLFKARADYEYTCTETVNASQSTKRIFNKYHLQINAEYRQNSTLYRTEHNVYFAQANQSIANQPANYTYLKESRITHYEGTDSRVYLFQYDYDDYGNQISIIEPNGDKILRTFYPIDGESNACPAEPNGFIALLKQETVQPFITANGEVNRSTTMTYQSLPRIGRGHFIVLKRAENYLERVDHTYFNDKTSLEHGQPKSTSTTVNGQSSTSAIHYRYTDTALTVTKTITTHDSLTAASSVEIRLTDGQPIESVNNEGVKSSSAYDILGRVTQETVAVGTSNEAKTTYAYTVGAGVNQLRVTDAKGNQVVEQYNNAGKTIRVDQTDTGGILRTLSTSSYNSFGLLISQTQLDYLQSGKVLSLITQYQYDLRGEVNNITHPDGRIETIKQNPISLLTRHDMEGLMSELSQFDLSGQLLTKETLDSTGTRLAFTANSYDGFGNLLTVTDTSGHVTTYAYDNADRPTLVRRVIDGVRVDITTEYAIFTNDSLPISTQVNGTVMGARVYDGLFRIVSETSTSGTDQRSYEGAFTAPSRVNTAKNDTVNFTYNKNLQVVTKSSVTGQADLDTTYQYDAQTGAVTQNQNSNSNSEYVYANNGVLIAEKATFSDNVQRSCTYDYSPRGDSFLKLIILLIAPIILMTTMAD